jgi:glutamate-1-semialdehyde 2,1-aminomutase
MEQDKTLRARAEAVIPGGMYGHQSVRLMPEGYPQFFGRAQGAYIWDADGRRYLDFMCGYGPNLFGYAHTGIDDACIAQLRQGDTMTGPSAMMVELAEEMTRMVTHADWAMFCKNGTDATTMAMMVARSHTRKSKIILARGAYHGSAPWCTPVRRGTTAGDRVDQVFCTYNDIESLEAAASEAGSDLAAIFAAPFRHDTFVDQCEPDLAYAKRAREICDQEGALLIVDDVRAGFRLARDCSWSRIGVEPDLSCWGKAIANGHPISAMLGADKARAAASAVYVTGSFWFSAAPMAAALATLKLIRETDYLEHTVRLGAQLRDGLDKAAARYGFGLRQTGPVQMPLILFEDDPGLGKGYAWGAALARRGVYVHPWHNMFLCAAMSEADIGFAVEAADAAFAEMRRSVDWPAPAALVAAGMVKAG